MLSFVLLLSGSVLADVLTDNFHSKFVQYQNVNNQIQLNEVGRIHSYSIIGVEWIPTTFFGQKTSVKTYVKKYFIYGYSNGLKPYSEYIMIQRSKEGNFKCVQNLVSNRIGRIKYNSVEVNLPGLIEDPRFNMLYILPSRNINCETQRLTGNPNIFDIVISEF